MVQEMDDWNGGAYSIIKVKSVTRSLNLIFELLKILLKPEQRIFPEQKFP